MFSSSSPSMLSVGQDVCSLVCLWIFIEPLADLHLSRFLQSHEWFIIRERPLTRKYLCDEERERKRVWGYNFQPNLKNYGSFVNSFKFVSDLDQFPLWVHATNNGNCHWSQGVLHQIYIHDWAIICTFLVNKWFFFILGDILKLQVVPSFHHFATAITTTITMTTTLTKIITHYFPVRHRQCPLQLGSNHQYLLKCNVM